jgi:DNA modification methylase
MQMEPRKLTKEDIDKVRHIEGFPIGTDEDIIALSDAPYYTACPNPFIEEFIKENGTPYDEATDDYHREPFAADVSEGKSDAIYNAFSYHTKVPHKAIMKYLLHYTNPGDIVMDGFCGSGMTGVAAQLCGSPDPEYKAKIKLEMPYAEFGCRKAVLNDLSPAATFIAYNYNSEYSVSDLQKEAQMILDKCTEECGWMYETIHTVDGVQQIGIDGSPVMGTIEFTIWSDVFVCPSCSKEFVFWKAAAEKNGTVKNKFYCPCCGSELNKRSCAKSQESIYDDKLGRVITRAKQVPVYIVYSIGHKRYAKEPDEADIRIIEKIESTCIPYDYPTDELPMGFNTEQPKKSHGINCVHQFFTKRNMWVLSCFWNHIEESKNSAYLKQMLIGSLRILSKQAKHNVERRTETAGYGWVNAGVMGTLYVSSCPAEQSVLFFMQKKISKLVQFEKANGSVCITTGSCTQLPAPPASVDYIFTDPPFGGNLNYSELSFLWEAWLKVKTNTETEAIINTVQGKNLAEYQQLMTQCFQEYYRVLKPNRWMTVEFHNSQNAVWNAIQESLSRAGFIIADVRTLDKKQGSFKQVTTSSAVKQDLVISAYKPKESFKRSIFEHAGSEETAWDFVRQHLENIPVVVIKGERIEVVAERQAYLLFDRMVAYHIMQGIPVPLDATDFYRGLDEKFLKRDNMYFLPDQVNEYDTARIKTDVENIQMSMFVTNEKTAISWLYQQLSEEFDGPQTYAELQPKFMQEVKSVDKFEAMPELATLLEENFLQDEKGRWYIPDTTKEGDVAKLREKKLWKEFEGYMNSKGKLKLFRSEAVRAGFSRLWKDKYYQAIVDIAERLPEQTIQEDPNLLMYYDISLSRV